MFQLRIARWDQEPGFSRALHQAATETAKSLQANRAMTLRNALENIANVRMRLSLENDPKNKVFGVLRKKGPTTVTEMNVADKPDNLYKDLLKPIFQSIEKNYSEYKVNVDRSDSSDPRYRKDFVHLEEQLPGHFEKTPLTYIEAFSSNGELHTIIFRHPNLETLDEIMSSIEPIFETLKNRSLSPQEVIQKVAELHFWLAHAMPYQRGSAATTDALTKSILMYHGITPGRWKPNFSPDIHAFVTPKDQFVKDYATFFEMKLVPGTRGSSMAGRVRKGSALPAREEGEGVLSSVGSVPLEEMRTARQISRAESGSVDSTSSDFQTIKTILDETVLGYEAKELFLKAFPFFKRSMDHPLSPEEAHYLASLASVMIESSGPPSASEIEGHCLKYGESKDRASILLRKRKESGLMYIYDVVAPYLRLAVLQHEDVFVHQLTSSLQGKQIDQRMQEKFILNFFRLPSASLSFSHRGTDRKEDLKVDAYLLPFLYKFASLFPLESENIEASMQREPYQQILHPVIEEVLNGYAIEPWGSDIESQSIPSRNKRYHQILTDIIAQRKTSDTQIVIHNIGDGTGIDSVEFLENAKKDIDLKLVSSSLSRSVYYVSEGNRMAIFGSKGELISFKIGNTIYRSDNKGDGSRVADLKEALLSNELPSSTVMSNNIRIQPLMLVNPMTLHYTRETHSPLVLAEADMFDSSSLMRATRGEKADACMLLNVITSERFPDSNQRKVALSTIGKNLKEGGVLIAGFISHSFSSAVPLPISIYVKKDDRLIPLSNEDLVKYKIIHDESTWFKDGVNISNP